jgi:N-methylhydantoinase A
MARRIIGIDTGGTFTDFVLLDGGEVSVHKEPSTPDNPARAVVTGFRRMLGEDAVEIVHGSTVATNALLERRGAKSALITTAGFEDVLAIGRQTRTRIYDLEVEKAPPLVPHDRTLGVTERVGPRGEIIEALADEDLPDLVARLLELDVDSVAICLLHSYANSEHEIAIRAAVEADVDAFITASHEVLPEFREYERCSTTVANAYVGPVMADYLADIGEHLDPDQVRIMQSNGGIVRLSAAQRKGVQTILSGPAGGVVGGFEIGRTAGYDHVITFDMGGTSTDVSLSPGQVSRTAESYVGELPIRLPVIDVHTVGAGGGSIAFRDPGGSLRVGPRSAGAVPGPICYDRGGEEITVTDANLYLGRLSSEHFLDGAQDLQLEPVVEALSRFANELGLSAGAAAEGILSIANATMERAIRVISMERGYDPRDFTLVCFGGAGAMHAAELARSLGIPRILVPQAAGILSALGMLLADYIRDYSQTLLVPLVGLDPTVLESAFEELERKAHHEYREEGFAAQGVVTERSVDMRYAGQGFELDVPASSDLARSFHERHERRYGYSDPKRPVELVNVRVRAVARTEKPPLAEAEVGGEDAAAAILGEHRMVFGGEVLPARLVTRRRLQPGHTISGPALVVEYSTTTVVPPDFRCRVDRWSNLILEPAK